MVNIKMRKNLKNKAMARVQVLRLINAVSDSAVDNMLDACTELTDEYKKMSNEIIYQVSSNNIEEKDLIAIIDKMDDYKVYTDKIIYTMEYLDTKEMEELQFLAEAMSSNKKEHRRLSETIASIITTKIAPVQILIKQEVCDTSLTFYKHLRELCNSLLNNSQYEFESIPMTEEEKELETKDIKYKYIANYKDLNRIVEKNGYSLERSRGDHGIFKNSDGNIIVIPQGREIGKGLSISIQKALTENNNSKDKTIL